MRVPLYQVDAFASRRFTGNPAAVMPLPAFAEDARLQAIAEENNLAETAFLVAEGDDYRIRWFTPWIEVPLCGHATLASAAVVMERLQPGRQRVIFHSASGPLTVERRGDGYAMDFPARASEDVAVSPAVAKALGVRPLALRVNEFNYMALLDSERTVRELAPDLAAVAALDRSGLIVTARGDREFDFVSRYFAPAKGIDEDPVTGGAHCMLAPFWAQRLDKNEFHAYQASRRGGELRCRLESTRVKLEGRCVFFLEGEAQIDA